MKITTIVSMFLLWTIGLHAQNDFFKNPPITISLYSHSIGLPFKGLAKQPLNLGIAVGTEFNYNTKDISSTHQRLQLGWYHHKNLSTGIWLKTDFVQRFTTKDGFFGEFNAGIGYLHEFNAQETFVFENGAYQSQQQGKGTFLAGGGIGGGYQWTMDDKWIVAPFVRYETWLQMPYSKFQAILPHSLLHVGTRIQMDK